MPFLVVQIFALLYLFLFWGSLVYWVWQDSQKRFKDVRLVRAAVALTIIFNLLGLLVYLMLRPPSFEETDHQYREDEILDLELEQLREWKRDKKTKHGHS